MISDVDADVPSTRIASGPGESGEPGIHHELQRRVAHVQRPELLIRLRDEPARHPHRHDPDTARISAQIDDEALAFFAGLHSVAERGHQPLGIQERR